MANIMHKKYRKNIVISSGIAILSDVSKRCNILLSRYKTLNPEQDASHGNMLREKNRCKIFYQIAIFPSWGQGNWKNTLGFAKFYYFLVKIALHLSESRCTLVKISLHPSQNLMLPGQNLIASWLKSCYTFIRISLHLVQIANCNCAHTRACPHFHFLRVWLFVQGPIEYWPSLGLRALDTQVYACCTQTKRKDFTFSFYEVSSAL